MPALPIDTDQIVITASRAPESEAQTPASVTIIDQQRIERLGEPLLSALLRLTPSAAVSTSGPGGSLTEVRIRGAEANHTLLFVDGIKVDDPASGDTPRYEILNADLASRIEVVRGPQSALWGSEAIGGVIAVNGLDDAPGYAASAEAGSFGFARGAASGSVGDGQCELGRRSRLPARDRDRQLQRAGRQGRLPQSLGPACARRGTRARRRDRRRRLGARAGEPSSTASIRSPSPIPTHSTAAAIGSRPAGCGPRSGPTARLGSGQIAGSLLGSSNRNFLADVD